MSAIWDMLSKVFGREHTSKEVAKERLRLVLVHDRSNVTPELMEHLREDLLKVISNYLEVEQQGFQVSLETTENQVALVANIPVRQLKRVR